MASLDQTLKSTDRLMRHVDDSLAPQVNATLKEAQEAMKNAKEALAATRRCKRISAPRSCSSRAQRNP